MTEPGESPKSRQSCVAPTEHAQSPSAVVLPRGRLDRLVHLTAAEAAYVHRRVWTLAGIRSNS